MIGVSRSERCGGVRLHAVLLCIGVSLGSAGAESGCAPGYGTSEWESGCVPCGISHFKPDYGDKPCTPCAENKAAWPLDTDEELQQYLNAGDYSIFRVPTTDESLCVCNTGYYTESDGACVNCPGSTVAYQFGSTECEAACPDGMEPNQYNANSCVCQQDKNFGG